MIKGIAAAAVLLMFAIVALMVLGGMIMVASISYTSAYIVALVVLMGLVLE